MYAIVNRLPLGKPLDAEILRKMEDFLARTRRENPDFLDARLISVSDTVAIVVAFYTTREALDEISSRVAGPWFAEHVRPYLAGPVDRQVGEVVAHLATS
jgi:predicted membrane-bound mannosyltransferase